MVELRDAALQGKVTLGGGASVCEKSKVDESK